MCYLEDRTRNYLLKGELSGNASPMFLLDRDKIPSADKENEIEFSLFSISERSMSKLEMEKIYAIFLKYVIVIVISIKLCQANSDLFDFEQVKNDLFSGDHFNTWNKSSAFNIKKSTETPVKCAIEFNQIKNGLKNMELWAIKRNLILIFVPFCKYFIKFSMIL